MKRRTSGSLGSAAALATAALSAGALSAAALAQPRWLVRALASRFPDVLFFVDTREPRVALTIDDGPDAATTDELLDVLGELGARATFFLLGDEARRRRNRRAMRRMADEGHELGNHLLRDEPAASLGRREFERQLLLAHGVLGEFAEPRFFRPGSGRFREWMLDVLRDHGYRCALGSIYPYDPHHPFTAYSRALIEWRARPGDVVVLHDRGARGRRTARVLARCIPHLAERGLQLTTLSHLTAVAELP